MCEVCAFFTRTKPKRQFNRRLCAHDMNRMTDGVIKHTYMGVLQG